MTATDDAIERQIEHDATIVAAQALVEMLRCPYYRNEGDRHCKSGCRDEPRCVTNGPWDDSVIEVLEAVADFPLARCTDPDCDCDIS